jgi:hypothetical protein
MAWIPRSPHDEADGLVWLPRLIDKARRSALGRASGADLMNGYLYGNSDYIDGRVLRFLGIDDVALSELVHECNSDEDVAAIVLAHSGHTVTERRAFSAALERRLFGFAMLDADEGRLAPGPRRRLITFLYNAVVMPIAYPAFRRAERRRTLAADPTIFLKDG